MDPLLPYPARFRSRRPRCRPASRRSTPRWPTSRARLPDGCWLRASSTSSSRTDRFALPPLTARRPRGGSPRGGRRDLALPAQTRDNQGTQSRPPRSEEHTSELRSLMRISYAVFCLKKKQETPQPHLYTTSYYTQ